MILPVFFAQSVLSASQAEYISITTATPESPTHFAQTLLNAFPACELILVKNTYSQDRPRLGKSLAHQSIVPILILDTLRHLKPPVKVEYLFDPHKTKDKHTFKSTYNVKHVGKYCQREPRIFFSFLSPSGNLREAVLAEPAFYMMPSDEVAGFAFDLNDKRDIIIQLIDVQLPWGRNKYNTIQLTNLICRIPAHMIMIEYNLYGGASKAQAFYLHLRCENEPICMEAFSPKSVSELTVGLVKGSVRKSQGNFEAFPIFVGSGDSKPFSWTSLRSWEQVIWRTKSELRSKFDILMPLYVLANKLNFTMESKAGKPLRQAHACICGQVFHGLYQDHLGRDRPTVSKHTNVLHTIGGHMLLCGAFGQVLQSNEIRQHSQPISILRLAHFAARSGTHVYLLNDSPSWPWTGKWIRQLRRCNADAVGKPNLRPRGQHRTVLVYFLGAVHCIPEQLVPGHVGEQRNCS